VHAEYLFVVAVVDGQGQGCALQANSNETLNAQTQLGEKAGETQAGQCNNPQGS
jgi:hypothetical protein